MNDPNAGVSAMRMKRRCGDQSRHVINRNHVDRVVYFRNQSKLNTPLDESDQEIVRISHYPSLVVS